MSVSFAIWTRERYMSLATSLVAAIRQRVRHIGCGNCDEENKLARKLIFLNNKKKQYHNLH